MFAVWWVELGDISLPVVSFSMLLLFSDEEYVRLCLWLAFLRAFWEPCLASLNLASVLDMLERRVWMDSEISLMIAGGWFDST